ncbi:MAG: hypothetical protein RBR37_03575 [Advenella sp.]|nr:hypothetical protein [Advenella sp.]
MFFSDIPLHLIFLLGIIVVFIGIGLKDHNPGIVVMGLGLIVLIYVVIQKAIEVFGY